MCVKVITSSQILHFGICKYVAAVCASLMLASCGGGGGGNAPVDGISEVPPNVNTLVVSTFAGIKETFVNGTGASTTFSSLQGIAVDGNGNVYVADTLNHAIRKITPAGTVSTFAGSGEYGFSNGTGTAATFRSPTGVSVDTSGNVYVADSENHAIRKITSNGLVSTFAGSGSIGFVNGSGNSASFNQPTNVVLDNTGNVYVADTLNHVIRKINTVGMVSTFAGIGTSGFSNGSVSTASFSSPKGIAVDSAGNVFISDTGNSAIRKISTAGIVSTFAGGGGIGFADGTGTAASFSELNGLVVDQAGNVFVADTINHAIRKISPSGLVSTFAGGSGPGSKDDIGIAATFDYPYGVAIDGNGQILVADSENKVIRAITPTGIVSIFAGSASRGFADGSGIYARFRALSGVAVDINGNVFVADTDNHAIRKISPTGAVSTIAGLGTAGFSNGNSTIASFNHPVSVALDIAGNIFVADTWNHAIRKITPSGVVTTLAGSGSPGFANGTISTGAAFAYPQGVAVDKSGNVFVGDTDNNVVRKITQAGVVTTFAGSGLSGLTNGVGTTASFDWPKGLAIDDIGNVFVADAVNRSIRKITPTGVVSTLAGNGSRGFSDGIGTTAMFAYPQSVAVDIIGNVFVADSGNNAIRKISPAGLVSTLSGDGLAGYRNGTSNGGARYSWPQGVAVGGAGEVFVADNGNNAVRIILP